MRNILLSVVFALFFSTPSAWADIEDLVYTYLPEVDMDGDGKTDVWREYEDHGILKRIRYDNNHDGRADVEVSFSEGVAIEYRFFRHNGGLSRKENLNFKAGKQKLVSKEIFWSSSKDAGPFDNRALWEFSGGAKARVSLFKKSGGVWIPGKQGFETIFYFNNGHGLPNPAPADKYFECLSMKGKQCQECERAHQDLLNKDAGRFIGNLQKIQRITCKNTRDNMLFLESGYRVDLKTCSNTGRLDVIVKAAEASTNAVVKCLHSFNVQLALALAQKIMEKRPLIKCLNEQDIDRELQVLEFSGEEQNEIKQNLASHRAAFYSKSTPQVVYLVGHNPMTNSGITPSELAPTIFHETIHAAELNPQLEAADHNTSTNDGVYGCEKHCFPRNSGANIPSSAIHKCKNWKPGP
ncbi:MAG: hypothetical protein A2583_15370 [Bdellovibrionales bacterium RIFOXYD1_FULL_53_11]|nr:MAG: hypothetical protein A2583_15370 [Bdellovibrionales bacterium RIFOXYD1_FULL_53_11]